MRYYLDTEFDESGHHRPLMLLSIALVREDGASYYAENQEADYTQCNEWVVKNVLPHFTGPQKSRSQIARDLMSFIAADPRPVFWGYYADYDWVLFCQLFGTMVNLPDLFPKYCLDLMQLAQDKSRFPAVQRVGPAHHALSDARWMRDVHELLIRG